MKYTARQWTIIQITIVVTIMHLWREYKKGDFWNEVDFLTSVTVWAIMIIGAMVINILWRWAGKE